MAPRTLLVLVLAFLGCGGPDDLGGGVGMHDIDDVTGGQMTTGEEQVDIAEDAAQAGLRFHDDGDVEAGGTDEGEVGIRVKPEGPDAGIDWLIPPVELPDDEPLP